jgi:hypothetical protein
MVNCLLVGCGQRIAWVAPQVIRAYFTHVGRVAVITADGHARLPHHRIKHASSSVSDGCFDALVNAYVVKVKAGMRIAVVLRTCGLHRQLSGANRHSGERPLLSGEFFRKPCRRQDARAMFHFTRTSFPLSRA